MFKSDKHKFYFTHIPKTGGTSIKSALLPFANPGQLTFDGEKVTDGKGFRPHKVLTREQANKYHDYFKFAFVRNPWARYASLYRFLRYRGSKDAAGLDFHQFLHKVVTNRNQYSLTQMHYGLGLMDYVGTYENLERCFKHICNQIGIPEQPLGHYKNQGDYDYRKMYNFKTKHMVANHCVRIIDEFMYTF